MSEETYEVMVNASYTEFFDVDASCPGEAREIAYQFLQEDIAQGVISVEDFDIESHALKHNE